MSATEIAAIRAAIAGAKTGPVSTEVSFTCLVRGTEHQLRAAVTLLDDGPSVVWLDAAVLEDLIQTHGLLTDDVERLRRKAFEAYALKVKARGFDSAAAAFDGWKIRHFSLNDPDSALGYETFETELAATSRFSSVAKRARENGGGADLIFAHERISRVMCAAEND